MYHHELEDELLETLSSGDKWKQMVEAGGYTRKQAGKEWFDEECDKVNEEKNACRVNVIQRRKRTANNKNRQARLN
jgi:hypothetical protein